MGWTEIPTGSPSNPVAWIDENGNVSDTRPDGVQPSAITPATKPGTFSPSGVYEPLKTGGSTSEMLADITKSTYQDWKDKYLPIALQQMNETTYNNPDLVNQGVRSAVGNVNSAFDAASGVRQRTESRYGVSPDAAQQASATRVENMGRSTAVVDAANRIRQRLADRNREIATTGIPNLAGKNMGG